MKSPARFFRGLVLMASISWGQSPQPSAAASHYLEIKLPPGVLSEDFFVRYALAGDDFGGWVRSRPGVSSYAISTTRQGHPSTRIRAILYAPGCALRTLDLPVSGSNQQPYSFVCEPLSSVFITGALNRSDRLYGREVKLQAKYVARWAQSFLELGKDIVTSIPVGAAAYLSPDGHFRLSVPDLSQDPLAGAPDHPGDVQIWAREKASGDIVAQLIPSGPEVSKARMGGLKILSEYPADTVFTPCAVNPPQAHDARGFALRPDIYDACNR